MNGRTQEQVASSTGAMDPSISRRIAITRYLMVIAIVVLHVPPYRPLSELGGTPFELLQASLSNGLFRAAVPMLTAISGFLSFRVVARRAYVALVRTKVGSLLVPLILWNLPFVLVVYVLQRTEMLDHGFSVALHPFSARSWLDATTGLWASPLNYPLHFLRDLFVIALFIPIFGWFLTRSPWLGLLAVSLVYSFNLDGSLVLQNNMIVAFYVGGLAAVRDWDLTRLDRFALPALLILVLLSVAMVLTDVENRELFRLVSPFLVWPATSLICGLVPGGLLYRNSGTSFFTFLSHGPILLLLWLGYQNFATRIPYPVFWLVAPAVCIVAGVHAHAMLKRWFPQAARVLLGGR